MNIFLKQATRRPLFTTLLVLLLSFSVLLSCIGYSAWESAKTQKSEISNGYTTIAIPIEPDLSNLSPEEIATALQNRVFADNAAQEAPQITMVDRRCLLSAHIAGSRSLSSSSIDPSECHAPDDGRHRSIPAYFRTVFVSEFPQNELDDPWCSPLGQVIQGSIPGNHHGTYSFGNPCSLVWHMCCNCAI